MCPLIEAGCLFGCRVVSWRRGRSWKRSTDSVSPPTWTRSGHARMDLDRWTHPFLGQAWPEEGQERERTRQLRTDTQLSY